MADSWTRVFHDTIGGRSVTGEIYDDGGYKVTTTQKSDHDGGVSGDKSSTIIISPSAAGTPIEIDADTLKELESKLVTDGDFSKEEAEKIVGKFQT